VQKTLAAKFVAREHEFSAKSLRYNQHHETNARSGINNQEISYRRQGVFFSDPLQAWFKNSGVHWRKDYKRRS